jgi:hypothetical protein
VTVTVTAPGAAVDPEDAADEPEDAADDSEVVADDAAVGAGEEHPASARDPVVIAVTITTAGRNREFEVAMKLLLHSVWCMSEVKRGAMTCRWDVVDPPW